MKGEFVCRNCGSKGLAKKTTKGSLWIEVILWLCFFVPGIIYSIWRLVTRYPACKACGSPEIVPVESPKGKELVKLYENQQAHS